MLGYAGLHGYWNCSIYITDWKPDHQLYADVLHRIFNSLGHERRHDEVYIDHGAWVFGRGRFRMFDHVHKHNCECS